MRVCCSRGLHTSYRVSGPQTTFRYADMLYYVSTGEEKERSEDQRLLLTSFNLDALCLFCATFIVAYCCFVLLLHSSVQRTSN